MGLGWAVEGVRLDGGVYSVLLSGSSIVFYL